MTTLGSVQNAEHSGWLAHKQKGWLGTRLRRRWTVLSGPDLYLFANSSADALSILRIQLEASTQVVEETSGKGKRCYALTVTTNKCSISFGAETKTEVEAWVQHLRKAIDSVAVPSTSNESTAIVSNSPATPSTNPADTTVLDDDQTAGIQNLPAALRTARVAIPFLGDSKHNLFQFWKMWAEQAPKQGAVYEVDVCVSLEEATWRVTAPQALCVQGFVDFFFTVGAPESEIDRFNEIGGEINPSEITCWVEMSARGGMDGGWAFPKLSLLSNALLAADDGDIKKQVERWASSHHLHSVSLVGREMGSEPPRLAELAFSDVPADVAAAAFDAFGLPPPPPMFAQQLSTSAPSTASVRLAFSSNQLVRLSVARLLPTEQEITALASELHLKRGHLSSLTPAFGEVKQLWLAYHMPGFGYNMYTEGFKLRLGFELPACQ